MIYRQPVPAGTISSRFTPCTVTQKKHAVSESELTSKIHQNRELLESILELHNNHIPELAQMYRAVKKAQRNGSRYLSTKKRLQSLESLFDNLLSRRQNDDVTGVAEKGKELITELFAAANQLVLENYKTAENVAKRCGSFRNHSESLVQEGIIGLIKAAYKFDPSFNVQFKTYAEYWARQCIMSSLQDLQAGYRLPLHFLQNRKRYDESVAELKRDLKREPDDREVADHMKVSVKIIQLIQETSLPVLSMDYTGADGESELTESFGAVTINMTEKMEKDQLAAVLRKYMAKLPHRERDILEQHFGFRDGEKITYKEIASRMGISRERARQIAIRGMRMLQFHQKHFRDFFDAAYC